MEVNLQLRQVARHEPPVLANRVTAHRRGPPGHPLLEKGEGGEARAVLRVHAGLDPLNQTGTGMVHRIPLVHGTKYGIVLVDGDDRPLGQAGQLAVSDDGGDFDDRIALRVQPGHFHVHPDEIVGILHEVRFLRLHKNASVTNSLDSGMRCHNNEPMSKRKLSRQQSWRIGKIREERARRADRRDAMAEQALAIGELGPEQQGLVTAHFGTQVEVESDSGKRQRCHLRANLEGLVTGDRVVWCEGEPTGVVVAQLARHGVLSRPDPYGKLKAVAANIDQIILVIAPLPEPHAQLIDRYLVAAEAVGIEPVILVNKTDLLAENRELRLQIDDLLAIYPQLGYRILHTSSLLGGLDELRDTLRERTSIFVGQSGVGKSSLVNTLLPAAELRVGELSESSSKGTHTTTTAQLFHLPSGGSLIDSPGIREFGLWHMSREQVEQGFREFRPLLGHCRFRDCRHRQEPGCAILEALQAGAISERRMESYRTIVAGLEAP